MSLSRRSFLTSGLLFTASLPAAPDWTSLFDGHTPTQWREITGAPFPERSWTITDGCLKPRTGLPAFQDLRTVSDYTDFEFSFEFKLAPGANSGVKYLIQRVDEWPSRTGKGTHARARGFEFQLVDDIHNADALSDPTRTTGALYGLLPPVRKVAPEPGRFHSARLVVSGHRVEHWVNEERVLQYELGQPSLVQKIRQSKDPKLLDRTSARSPISLQHHDSEIWFRSLKVRPLP